MNLLTPGKNPAGAHDCTFNLLNYGSAQESSVGLESQFTEQVKWPWS